MNNKTRIIDLNVGQLKQLLSGVEFPIKQSKIENYEGISFEKERIQQYFKIPTENNDMLLMTATQIKHYIEEQNTGNKICNMRFFGRELKNLFGKPMQKRGLGYCYKISKL